MKLINEDKIKKLYKKGDLFKFFIGNGHIREGQITDIDYKNKIIYYEDDKSGSEYIRYNIELYDMIPKYTK